MSTIATIDGIDVSGALLSRNGTHASTHALFVIPRERGDGFLASIRGHILDLADPSLGSLAPNPDDLFAVAIASELAWSARRFLRAYGLPDGVSVSATWPTQDEPHSLADINLTVSVSGHARTVLAELTTVFENCLERRSVAGPVIDVSFEGAS